MMNMKKKTLRRERRMFELRTLAVEVHVAAKARRCQTQQPQLQVCVCVCVPLDKPKAQYGLSNKSCTCPCLHRTAWERESDAILRECAWWIQLNLTHTQQQREHTYIQTDIHSSLASHLLRQRTLISVAYNSFPCAFRSCCCCRCCAAQWDWILREQLFPYCGCLLWNFRVALRERCVCVCVCLYAHVYIDVCVCVYVPGAEQAQCEIAVENRKFFTAASRSHWHIAVVCACVCVCMHCKYMCTDKRAKWYAPACKLYADFAAPQHPKF